MKRIGIFHFYNPYGLVEEYIEDLLNSMKTILSDLIVVCNGNLKEEEFQKLSHYTAHVFKRENKGYDAGGYKDILLEKNIDFWINWDELVLFNCTFYGPIFPLDEIFEQLDKRNIDFWGLSKNIGGRKMRIEGYIAPEHLQSYFLVVKKSMFSSPCFWDFWRNLKYPENYYEAVENFEWNFTSFFSRNGFKYTSWLDIQGYDPYLFKEPDPTFYPYELLKDYKFPIIKCKAMSIANFDQMKKTIEYLENSTDYNRELIEKHIARLDHEGLWKPFSVKTLEEFVEKYSQIYIFGNGKYGYGVERYFLFRNWKFVAHVVSNPKKSNEISLGELKLQKGDGLIIALGSCALESVKQELKEAFDEDQMLFPTLN